MERLKGCVVKFSSKKRYGFIESLDGKQYFFHQNDLSSSGLKDGGRVGLCVTFIASRSEKGLCAKEVSMADTFKGLVLTPSFETRQDTPYHGEILDGYKVVTGIHGSKKSAEAELKSLKVKLGGNALISKKHHKTDSEGAECYQFSGVVSLVVQPADFWTLEDKIASDKSIEINLKVMRDKVGEYYSG